MSELEKLTVARDAAKTAWREATVWNQAEAADFEEELRTANLALADYLHKYTPTGET